MHYGQLVYITLCYCRAGITGPSANYAPDTYGDECAVEVIRFFNTWSWNGKLTMHQLNFINSLDKCFFKYLYCFPSEMKEGCYLGVLMEVTANWYGCLFKWNHSSNYHNFSTKISFHFFLSVAQNTLQLLRPDKKKETLSLVWLILSSVFHSV